MLEKEVILVISYGIGVVLVLSAFVIIFFIAFQRRKNKLLVERFEAEKQFQEELTTTQLEIQEETQKNIAWELHDNVSQLLSVAKMQLNMIQNTVPDDHQDGVEETKSLISNTLEEVRALSRTLNSDVVSYNGLQKSIAFELERFERLDFLIPKLVIKGEPVPIDPKEGTILFRICQEFFSNVIKHAKAKNLTATLSYEPNSLAVTIEDNGVGFDMSQKSDNSGLRTMKARAELVGAEYSLTSSQGEGTTLSIVYPLEKTNAVQ